MFRLVYSLLFLIFSGSISCAIMEIGYEADNQTLEFSGEGTVFSTNIVRLGYKGNSNRFNVVNGAVVTTEACYVGMTSTENYHGDGIPAVNNGVEVVGNGSFWDAGAVRIGYGPESRNNTLTIRDGAEAAASSCVVGLFGGNNNRLVVTDAGSELTVSDSGDYEGFTVGYRGGGHSMIISNGASVTTRTAVLAYGHFIYECEENEILVTGAGSQWNSGDFSLATGGYAMNNAFRVQDGAKVFSDNAAVGDGDASGSLAVISGNESEWNISGLLTVNAVQRNSTANSVVIENGGRITVEGFLSLNENLYGDMVESRLELNDGGTLVLGSDFDASGPGFHFNGGSVLHARAGLTGLDEVGADRTLIAHQLTGDLTLHGTWSVGAGITNGTLAGGLSIADVGMLAMEITASGNDQLEIQGDAVLGGTLQLTAADGSVLYGSSFQLFDWQGEVSGRFDDLYCSTLGEGLSFDDSDLYTSGQLHVVPEPATAGLMGISVLCLYMMRVNRGRFGTYRCSLRFRRSAIRTPAAEGW